MNEKRHFGGNFLTSQEHKTHPHKHTHTHCCVWSDRGLTLRAQCVCVTDVLSVSLQNVLIYNVSMTKESVSHTTQAERTNNRQKTSVQKSPTSDILCCSRCQTLSLTALQLSGRSRVSFQLFNLHFMTLWREKYTADQKFVINK